MPKNHTKAFPDGFKMIADHMGAKAQVSYTCQCGHACDPTVSNCTVSGPTPSPCPGRDAEDNCVDALPHQACDVMECAAAS